MNTSLAKIAALSFLVAPVMMHSQTLPSEEIEVVKHFEAKLMDAQKQDFTPRLPAPDSNALRFTYDLSVSNPVINYQPPQIRPLAIRAESADPAYRGLLRLGYGVPNAILGDLSYQLVDKEPFGLYIAGHHHSANLKKNPLQKFSESGGVLKGSYALSDAIVISSKVSYDVDKVNFYGLEENDDTPYVDPGRTFKTLRWTGGISNAEPLPGDIHYRANLNFYNLQDDLSAKETGLGLDAHGEKWFHEKHSVSLDLLTDMSTLKDTEQKRTIDNLFLTPAYTFHGASFAIRAGARLASDGDEFSVFPDCSAEISISESRLIAFAAATGNLAKNSLLTMSTVNPFIHQRINEINNTKIYDYSAGIKGKVRKVEYEGKVRYSTVENLLLFVPDEFDYRKFQPLYDDGNLIRIEGVVKTQPVAQCEAGISVAKVFYDLDNEEKAWHLPAFRTNVFARFNSLNRKLHLRGDLFVETGVPYMDELGDPAKLKGLFDVSLSADYYIREHVGAFVQINNLFGNQQMRWQRYPVYGINGVAGILVRI